MKALDASFAAKPSKKTESNAINAKARHVKTEECENIDPSKFYYYCDECKK